MKNFNPKMRQSMIALSALLATTAFAPAASAADVSIFLWQYDEPGISTWWRNSVAAYEAETGNRMVVRNTTGAQYYQQLVIEMASGDAADVIGVNTSNLHELVSAGKLKPLDDLLSDPAVKARIQSGGWDALTVDGKIYAVPIAGRTLEMIYNACYFEEAGISGPPTTPEEYLAAARKLTKRDESGNITRYGTSMMNASEDPTYEMLLMWTIAHGGRFADADGQFALTSEPVEKALTFMKTIYDEGLAPRGMSETDQRSLFATGKTAMTIDGQWQFPFVEQNNPDHYDCYKSASRPWDGVATGGVTVALALNADAKEPEAAQAFLELITRPEIQSTFADHSPFVPFGVDAVSQEQIASRPYLEPWLKSIGTAIPITVPGHENQFNTIWPIVVNGVVASLQDGVEPKDALAEVQDELEGCCGK